MCVYELWADNRMSAVCVDGSDAVVAGDADIRLTPQEARARFAVRGALRGIMFNSPRAFTTPYSLASCPARIANDSASKAKCAPGRATGQHARHSLVLASRDGASTARALCNEVMRNIGIAGRHGCRASLRTMQRRCGTRTTRHTFGDNVHMFPCRDVMVVCVVLE